MNKLFLLSAAAFSLLILSFRNVSVTAPSDDWDVPAKYQDMENPYGSSADAMEYGKELYAKHCKSCHGKTGEGDGPKSEELDTDCGDFTTDEFKGQTEGTIYYKTVFGRDDMPAFDKKIADEEDRWAVVTYILNF